MNSEIDKKRLQRVIKEIAPESNLSKEFLIKAQKGDLSTFKNSGRTFSLEVEHDDFLSTEVVKNLYLDATTEEAISLLEI